MKRLILTTGLLLLGPAIALNASAQSTPTPENENEETSTQGNSSMNSSGVNQTTSVTSIYAKESAVKLNTFYLGDSSASGIYGQQYVGIGNAGIERSNVNINNISVYSSDVSSSTIKQTMHGNGMDIQGSTLEINRVVLY